MWYRNAVILVAGDLLMSNTRDLSGPNYFIYLFSQCASNQNPVCLLSQAKIVENNKVIKHGTA